MVDGDGCSPPWTRSFQATQAPSAYIPDLTKKRKLELEQLDLPSPKYQYRDQGCSIPVIAHAQSPETESEDLPGDEVNKMKDKGVIPETSESQFGSAKGSNSFIEDAESMISVHAESTFDPKYTKYDERASTSTMNKEIVVSEDGAYRSDGFIITCRDRDKGKSAVGMGEERFQHIYDESQLCETLEEHLLEFGCHLGYTCSEHGDDCSKQCAEKNAEEFFGLNRDNCVLSSEQRNTNEEPQSVPKKPTIDQEFEEYFSVHMM